MINENNLEYLEKYFDWSTLTPEQQQAIKENVRAQLRREWEDESNSE